jgi:membrane protease YdiL (CAAX protease family)
VTGRKLVAWAALVGGVAALNYVGRFSGGKTPRNAVYRYDLAVSEVVVYLIIFGLFLWIARGLTWDQLGIRRPRPSWPRAIGLGAGIFVAVFIAESLLEPLLHPSREQGLAPTRWEPSRAGAFALFAFSVVLLGPLVEELLFRGLGFGLLSRYGTARAVVGTATAFAFWHGLVDAWPPLFIFGLGIAILRLRTRSILPGLLFHAFFNGAVLALALAT